MTLLSPQVSMCCRCCSAALVDSLLFMLFFVAIGLYYGILFIEGRGGALVLVFTRRGGVEHCSIKQYNKTLFEKSIYR
jgi:hypothetical protein